MPMKNIANWIKKRTGVVLICSFLVLISILFLINYFTSYQIDFSDKAFLLSFSASLIEDLIFFSLIGVVLYFSSFKKLEDSEVNVRLNTVINSPNVSKGAQDYFQLKSKQMLAYYESFDVKLTIKEYDSTNSAYKLYMEVDAKIVNMCKDLIFQGYHANYIKSGIPVSGDFGECILYLLNDDNDALEQHQLINGVPVKLGEKIFNKTIPLIIKSNGHATFKMTYYIWSKYEQTVSLFTTKVDRFVNSYSLTVINSLDKNLFEIKADKITYDESSQVHNKESLIEKDSATVDVGRNGFQLIQNQPFKPQESVEIFFSKPSEIKKQENKE